jgi:hypothetical protein
LINKTVDVISLFKSRRKIFLPNKTNKINAMELVRHKKCVCRPQIYTYSRYWIAVNNLVRAMVPLTRVTNADFAHHYELYIINWRLGD